MKACEKNSESSQRIGIRERFRYYKNRNKTFYIQVPLKNIIQKIILFFYDSREIAGYNLAMYCPTCHHRITYDALLIEQPDEQKTNQT